MARVFTIDKSRKAHKCGSCGDTIPVGAAYRWLKQRYGGKKIRCTKPACEFKASDRSGAKSALVHDAIDEARTAIGGASCVDEITDALQAVADTAREIGDEYREASSAWAGGSHEQFEEWADTCESYASDLEGWQASEDEDDVRADARMSASPADDAGTLEQAQDEAWEDALQSMRDEATDLLDGFEL